MVKSRQLSLSELLTSENLKKLKKLPPEELEKMADRLGQLNAKGLLSEEVFEELFLPQTSSIENTLNDSKKSELKNAPYELSDADLRDLIAQKNKKRPIDCKLVASDSELKGLMENLAAYAEDKENPPKRFQMLMSFPMTNRTHWSAFDILCENGKIKIFMLDAAGDVCNLIRILPFLGQNVEFTSCGGKLQTDGKSCSIFALDHVFKMSKMQNLHGHLDKVRKKSGAYFEVDPLNLPSALVKNAQSLSFLKEHAARHAPDEKVNKKGETMAKYLRKHTTFMVREKDKSKVVSRINDAISDKQQKYRKKLAPK